MKNKVFLFFFFVMLCCGPASAENAETSGPYSQLYGKKIGVLTGTVADQLVREHLPGATPVYCGTLSEMVIALDTRRIDALLIDEPLARVPLREKSSLQQLPGEISRLDNAFFFANNDRNEYLCEAFSEQIRLMKLDGTLERLTQYWTDNDPAFEPVSLPESDYINGVLKMATIPQYEPTTFIRKGQVVGYDIDVARLAAAKLGFRLEPVIVDMGSYFNSVLSGKADFGGGCTNVTPERESKVLFTETVYQSAMVVLVRKEDPPISGIGFKARILGGFKELADSFERTFIRENRWKLLLQGLTTTLVVTCTSALLGTLLGFVVCAMRRSKRGIFKVAAKCYIAAIQGTPLVVILMVLYFLVFARANVHGIFVAIVGFSMNFSVHVGESMRTSWDAIPRGQYEAALALGFKRSTAFWKVLFPQMLRRMLPIYRGDFTTMLKMTAIVGYIAIQDLTKMSDIIRSRTYDAFFPLMTTAVTYFLIARTVAWFIAYLNRQLDPKHRRQRKT